jgi:hypothetical protein
MLNDLVAHFVYGVSDIYYLLDSQRFMDFGLIFTRG